MELMKLTEQEKREIGVTYKPTKINKIVDDFIYSDEEIMELKCEEGEYRNVSTCVNSVKQYLRRTNKNWLGVKTSKGRVFIFKAEPRPLEDEEKICIDCGESFTLTANNKKWLAERGLRHFTRCEKCRKQRKLQQSN